MSGGLASALRERGIGLLGVTNGVDPGHGIRAIPKSGPSFGFDPSAGTHGKNDPGRSLPRRLAFREAQGASRAPLYAFVGRLTGQKGIDVFEAIQRILLPSQGCRFVVLGQGEKQKESMLASSRQILPPVAGFFIARYDRASQP